MLLQTKAKSHRFSVLVPQQWNKTELEQGMNWFMDKILTVLSNISAGSFFAFKGMSALLKTKDGRTLKCLIY